MQVIKTPNLKVSPETNRKRHKRYKSVREPFIVSCGENFLKRGKLIQGHDIHHQVPLSMKEGNSSFDNMCIIPRSFHNFINYVCYEPQMDSKSKWCYFPKFARVVDDKGKEKFCNWLEKGIIR
jgi:hypothetical protein